ncbi:MAG TPA: hypothetical protein VK249_14130 [Anaerolineales bacterium]|nr:hypothetical protein [Anaerolineales bacterium]
MSDWKRTTKEVPFESLPPEFVSAINQHVEQYNLGPILSEALMCVQTDSEKVNKGLFGGAELVRGSAIVTPRWLVWAVHGTKTPTAVLSAQLRDITVQDYAQTPFMKMVPDSGIEVSGRFTDVRENTSAFIGMDDGPAGRKFKDLVIKAAQDAKK